MRIIGLELLGKFKSKHPDSRNWLDCWLNEVKRATWTSPHDVKRLYASASIVGNQAIVFNVKGNDYRLEVKVAYNANVISIHWIGTHSEYTKKNRKKNYAAQNN